jgi:integrase
MARKRSHGEGYIKHLPSGKWHAELSLGGKRIYYTGRTRNEVVSWIRKTGEQIEQGLTYQAASMTLGEYLQNWLASNESSVRASTHKHYKSICDHRLIPQLGSIPMKDLTADRIQSTYDQWKQEGVGLHVISKAHSVLHHALRRAEQTGLVIRNVAGHVKPPKVPQEEMKCWSEAEANQFLTTASSDRLYALYYLALATGMREMELFGLQWQDLEGIRNILHVRRQLTRSGGSFAPQKTKAAKRSLELGSGTLTVLQDHYQKQIQERNIAGDHWHENDLIFTSTIGTSLNYKNVIERSFKPLMKAAGVPVIRFHDLRHTAASLMISKGISVFVVSKILGHARPSITSDIYGHLVPGAMSGIGDMMDEMIAPIQIEFSHMDKKREN